MSLGNIIIVVKDLIISFLFQFVYNTFYLIIFFFYLLAILFS